MTTSSDRVAIIGGGLGGLAAACTLAGRGYPVTLFERASSLGGHTTVWEEAGYRFDIGPTFLTMPRVLDRIFRECNRKLFDHLDLVSLDPQWRCFFPDGSVLDLCTDMDRMCEHLERFAPGSGKGYRRFLKLSKRMAQLTDKHLHWRSVGGIRTFLMALRSRRSVAQIVRSCVSDERIRQLLAQFAFGDSGAHLPAQMCGMAHIQLADGLWYPRGGIGAVPKALTQVAVELGVDVRASVGIKQIELDSTGRAVAVITDDGERTPVRAVVANLEIGQTHRQLLPAQVAATRIEKSCKDKPIRPIISLFLGLDRAYDHLSHHNFVFCNDSGDIARDDHNGNLTCYMCAPAQTDHTLAPPGGEALSIHARVRGLRPDEYWSAALPTFESVILNKLATVGRMPDLESRIKSANVVLSGDSGANTNVIRRSALRPANRSPDVPGLYFAGSSVHPGPGMAMELMSGWIAADALDEDAFRAGSQPIRRVEPY